MIRGFKLDPTTHDLALDAGGRLEYVEGTDATVQEIKTRLLHFQGESFNDLREGVPWYQEILVKGVDLARVRAIIRAAILSVPAIVDVPRVDVEIDRATRAATITWEAREASGRVVRSEDFAPLVIAAPVGRS
jgi:hypothetical protein